MHAHSWPETRIGDIGEVFTGRTPPTERQSYFGGEFPFITPTDMHQGKFARSTQRTISNEGAELLKRIQIPPNSICVSCIGWQMGEVIMTDRPSFTNQQINTIVPNGKVDPSFLFYSLLPRKSELLSLGAATGVRTPILNKSAFCDIKVKIPVLPLQRRIAGILSAYDDLIENNQRRIKILEEMAQSLYREWFVHFRFPGHDKVKMVSSPLGSIPQGWGGRFGDLVTIERDGINPFEFPQELFEHFSIPAFDNGRQPATELGETILSGKYCINSSCVLLSKLNPRIPRIWLPATSDQRRAITSTEFLVLKPRPGTTREFIYAKCCSEEFAGQFASLAIGTSTSHQRVKPENLLTIPGTVSDRSIIERFSSVVAPMLLLSQQLRGKTQNLRRTRDLLLPRLLSGQIAVKEN
ncbi:MAG: restriction endonuclease subunit S [Nitrospira sp.]|nr:restriction endonuclease subunit S [Nitrospira sp. NTP2]MCK6493690.1 restriction endonuclease subunit S [Nitrospira sp.]MEB2337654.1 restriction endonuclease subunit S [Nitrospirales bacterium]RIK59473.1 MAG: hypothetical protein DCC63_06835 [Nitrospira sp.]